MKYADVTRDGNEDPIVVVHYDTGGTQQTDYVYLYSLASGIPKPLAYFHSGDRAYSGLDWVYGKDGKLVVELSDLNKNEGDCCSSGLVRTRYIWQNSRFVPIGAPQFVTLKEP